MIASERTSRNVTNTPQQAEATELRLELPLPPTINHYYGYRNGKVRQIYITKDGKAFRHHVALEVMIKGARGRFERNRLALDIELNFQRRGADLDNRIKPLFDALERATLFENDRQIDEFHVKRGENIKGGRCVVRIWSV